MRLIATILLLLAAVAAYGQEIQGTRGITYTDGVPTHTPSSLASLVAIDLNTGIEYRYAGGSWRVFDMGFVLTGTTGAPGWTPDFNDPYMAANAGDSLYVYRDGAWRLLNDLPDLSGYLEWGDTLTLIATKADLDDVTVDLSDYPLRSELQDTAAAIRGDFPVNTDDQTLSLSGDTLSIEDGNSVVLPASGVTGSGTTGYVPYFTDSAEVGNSGLYWDAANSRLGIGTASPSSKVHVVGQSTFDNGASGDAIRIDNNGYINFGNILRLRGASTNFQYQDPSFNTNANISVGSGFTYFSADGGSTGIGIKIPTARLHVTGPGSTSATSALLVENSSGTDIIKATDDVAVGIGGDPVASSILAVTSTTKGFLPPRMTGTQAEAISSPAEGLMVYSTDGSGVTITSKGWWGYDGSNWVKLN